MPRCASPLNGEMLLGTLDMLVLRTLVLGAAHGHTIAHAIERGSEDVLQIEHGSLYPALHRLEDRGWIASFWVGEQPQSEVLPPDAGRAEPLDSPEHTLGTGAIGRILKPATE